MFYKRPFPTLWILIFLGCLSFWMQYITIEKLSVFSPAETFGTLTKYIQAIDAKVSFEWIDILLSSLFLAISALVLWKEISKRVLTDFLQNIFSSERKTLYLLLACSLVCVRFYFARGSMHWGADASHHIAQSYLVARAIADGELPIWTFLMGNGSPYMQNYGFAFFYLVGLVDFFCRDIFLSLKLVMGTSHVLSGIGMYYLASNLCQSRRAGFIAGLGYVLCFWHTQSVLIMGRLPLSLFYALLPWPFYAIECLIRSPYKVRAGLIGGLGIALLNFTHPGYGTYAMVFWGCYCIVRLWSLWGHPDMKSLFRAGILLLILGVAFSAYMNVGMWFEREHTGMHGFRAGLKDPTEQVGMSIQPDPTWRHLLGWSNHKIWLIPPEPLHWYGGYLGISLCMLALAGVGIALFRRNGLRHFAASWACLMLSILVSLPIACLPSICCPSSMPPTHPAICSFSCSFSHSLRVSVHSHFYDTAPGGSREIAVLPSCFSYYGSISSQPPSCTPMTRPLTDLQVAFKISGRHPHLFQSGASCPIIACIGWTKIIFPTTVWHTHSLYTKLRYPRDFTQENCVLATHLRIPSSR